MTPPAGPLSVLEPADGGEERIAVGASVALATISSVPPFTGQQIAEQEYQTPIGFAPWNGMRLQFAAAHATS
ncbi:MAG: hypothetical protein FJW31_04100 [Acidobacteria bacterium]|nr:hypothetical protein [Acidobacteriota bacterium]